MTLKKIDMAAVRCYNIKGGEIMELFKNENIIITDIKTVSKYEKLTDEQEFMRYLHNLPTYELIFFFDGDSRVIFGDKEMRDIPNSIRYLPKGASGGKYEVEAFGKNCCIDIYFDTDSPMPKEALVLNNMPKLKPFFEKIYNIWSEKRDGYFVRSMNILYEIIYLMKKSEALYAPSSKRERLTAAHDYIMDNYRKSNFDYEELKLTSGLSYSHFKKLFISVYGMSPCKFVTKMRIDYSKELLTTGIYSISEIADMCGYENVYYFSNVFKKNVGVSPKKYLKA